MRRFRFVWKNEGGTVTDSETSILWLDCIVHVGLQRTLAKLPFHDHQVVKTEKINSKKQFYCRWITQQTP